MTHEGTMTANPARFTIDCRGETCLTQDAADTLDLETCVCRYSLLLFRLAYGVLRNSHDAEDVVQETFLRAHRQGIASVRDTQAWLATVAFRIAVDRKRKTEPLPLAEYGVPSGQPNAERLAIRREQVERLQTLLTSLPEAFRQCRPSRSRSYEGSRIRRAVARSTKGIPRCRTGVRCGESDTAATCRNSTRATECIG